jgi:hypothetical protein|nr:MAG TPA: hypothetical protein [Bacteriophage sp.]
MNKKIIKTEIVKEWKFGAEKVPCRTVVMKYTQGDNFIEYITKDPNSEFQEKIFFDKETDVEKICWNAKNNEYSNNKAGDGRNNSEFEREVARFLRKVVRLTWESSSKKVFLTKQSKNLCIGDLNTGIYISYMGYLYAIISSDSVSGTSSPEWFFTAENAEEYIDEYIKRYYKLDDKKDI